MHEPIKALAALTRELRQRQTLEDILQVVVERSAELLETSRVSARLLDASRTQLLAIARAGSPLHLSPMSEFRLGEGLVGWVAHQGTALRSNNAEADPRFTPREGQKEPMGSFLGVPLLSSGACIGVLSAVAREQNFFEERHEDLLTVLAGLCAPHLEIARLRRLSQVDPLTGALNRRGLELLLPERRAPEDPPSAVVMVDIDHFKRVNDSHGHAIGDEVLRRVASILAGVLRGGDAVIRYGGEEFLIVLRGVERAQAARVAERARVAIAQAALAIGELRIAITISCGVAEQRPDEDRDSLIERADAALYTAKLDGRNRVAQAG